MNSTALKQIEGDGLNSTEGRFSSPSLQTSALERILLASPPKTPDSHYRWIASGTLSALWIGYLATANASIELSSLCALGIVFPSIALGLAWSSWTGDRAAERLFAKSLEAPLQELRDLHRFLDRYQSNLDMRTSRYFHCVTSTKVSAYFSLTQIRQGVLERVNLIDKLLENPTYSNLLKIFESVRGTMIFSDGVMPNSGTMRLVPISKIGATVGELIEGLEEGLQELEEEIKFNAVPSNDDDKLAD